MQGIANFIDDLMGGFKLISFAILIGGILWALFILRLGRSAPSASPVRATEQCIKLLGASALALGLTQLIALLVKGWILAATLGEFPVDAYIGTVQFQAGVIRFAFALCIWRIAARLRTTPDAPHLWRLVAGASVPLIVSGAWLVHAVGRFEDREALMAATVAHQVGAAVWFGGVVQLLALWRLSRRDAEAKMLWPAAVHRFSALGIASVVLLVVTGLPLAITYIGNWNGLLGTGYGSLVTTKVILLGFALVFAYRNLQAGRAWKLSVGAAVVHNRVPYFVEAETFVLVAILFIAATLSSQPPAIDIPHLTATVDEVAGMFTPRIPRIESPSHAALLAGEAGRTAIVGQVPSVAATEWSDYNHNISGIFLTGMSLVAMLSYFRRFTWAKYWPLGFVGLGVFLFFRSDAESWPLGPIGFWESTFGNGEVLQHRIATLVAFALGVMEMRARTRATAKHKLSYVFPTLCAAGGILLLTHAHVGFELKTQYLIQSTHTVMGLLAVFMAAGRWLELRIDGPVGRIAGLGAAAAMFLIGLCLLFYREPLY